MITMSKRIRLGCYDCRALEYKTWNRGRCGLGYKISNLPFENEMLAKAGLKFAAPKEPCPKPLTYSDLFEAQKYYKKKVRKTK